MPGTHAVRLSLAVIASCGALAAQLEWSFGEAFPRVLDPAVYDVQRGRIVLFTRTLDLPRTWERDRGAWRLRQLPASPPANGAHALAYDLARGRVVLFTGATAETWEYDGATWVRRTPAVSPPGRHRPAMTFDLWRLRTILFGGLAVPPQNATLGDTWEWDGATWTQRLLTPSPPPRLAHALAFDFARGHTLLFGGIPSSFGNTVIGDTWRYDGASWAQQSTTRRPSPRAWAAMAADVGRARIVLFGGQEPGGPIGDTWEWDGTNWNAAVPASAPSPRSQATLVHDLARGRTLLLGGERLGVEQGDLWEWDGANWTLAAAPESPLPSSRGTFVAVGTTGRCMSFGGQSTAGAPLDEHWEWDGTRWLEQSPSPRPFRRSRAAAVYDAARGRTILLGGSDILTVLGDQWEWDGAVWTQSTAALPPLRVDHQLVFDSRRDRVVLFGGNGTSQFLDDTWEWDGAQWLQAAPSASPPPRARHGMAYDDARGETVVFGGWSTTPLGDTWEWNGARWLARPSTNVPAPRGGHGMAYDAARQRVVVLGGVGGFSNSPLDDLWEWDGADWRQRIVPGAPPRRSESRLAYDPVREVVVVHSGIAGGVTLADVWELAPSVPARALAFGNGCSGASGPPLALATEGGARPWLGDTIALRTAAQTVAVFWLGLSRTTWNGGPLPQPLDALGLPGCTLLASPDELAFVAATGGAASLPIAIPNQPALLGLKVFAQAAALDPAANAFGAVTSNGLALHVGGR